MRKTTVLSFILLQIVMVSAALGQETPERESLVATTHLDRTALWVGDSLQYTVRVIHPADVEFVVENLRAENIALEPFIVRDVKIRQTSLVADQRLLEVVLQITSYDSLASQLTIPAFNLYYFVRTPGRIEGEDMTAEAVQVPATIVGVGSVVIGEEPMIRDEKAAKTIPRNAWLVPLLLGFAGLLLPGYRAGSWARAAMSKADSKTEELIQQVRAQTAHEFVQRIKAIEVVRPQGVFDLGNVVAEFLRGPLSQWHEVDGAGLTPGELETALKNTQRGSALASDVKLILEKCDWVRCAKNGPQAGKEWAAEMRHEVETLVNASEI